MPSKDTISARITKNTHQELQRIRKIIAKENGIDFNMVSKKQAEIIMRMKSRRGHITKTEVMAILAGKIR